MPFAAATPGQWGGTQLGTAAAQALGYTQWGYKRSGGMHGVPNSRAQPTPTPPPVRRIISIPLHRSEIVAGLRPERGIVAGVQPEQGILLEVRGVELQDPTNGGLFLSLSFCLALKVKF